jgi:hypothetical protein
MKRKAFPLPDLDDDEFTRRLKPLETMMLSPSKVTVEHNSVDSEGRLTGSPVIKLTGYPADRIEATLTPQELSLPSESAKSMDIRNTGIPEDRSTDYPGERDLRPRDIEGQGSRAVRNSVVQTDIQLRVIGAAERLVHIEQTRGPKRRFEYLIPQRVGDALARDAVSKGKSATVLLLEVLRDAGYPVIPEDLIDLRKERRR